MTEIRPLRPTDSLDDLIALSRAFFTEYESHHPAFFQIGTLHDSDIVNYFTRWLEDEAGETFVAVCDARIIAYITVYVQDQPAFWQVKQVGRISGLMVAPAYRQRGIAGELLAAAQSFFEHKGVRYFVVVTAVTNRPARHFYQKSGLSPLHTTLLGKI